MSGLPVMSGAVHDTSIFVAGVVALADTLMAGASGGSSSSVTLIVTAMVSSIFVSALSSLSLRSLTSTVTLYDVLAS